ncbi:MAG: hypothetical protein Tsb0021_13680 [Chlamydiales bacterium]
MQKLSFFTPVCYEDNKFIHRFAEEIDGFFSFSDEKAYVIPSSILGNSQAVTIKCRSEKHNVIKTAVKVALIFTVIVPLIVLAAKTAFRLTHQFHFTPTCITLSKNIDITEDDEKLLKNHIRTQRHVIEHSRLPGMFQIPEKNLVFHISYDAQDNPFAVKGTSIYDAILSVKEVLDKRELDRLHIPQTKFYHLMVDDKTYSIMAQVVPQVTSEESDFENWEKYVDQRLTLVAKCSNLDLEHWISVGDNRHAVLKITPKAPNMIGNAEDPHYGHIVSFLQECTEPVQVEYIIGQAINRNLLSIQDGQDLDEICNNKINGPQKIQKFYQDHNILTGDQPITIALDELGLNLDATFEADEGRHGKNTYILRDVAKNIIQEINDHLKQKAKRNRDKPIQEQRYIFISSSSGLFNQYSDLGLDGFHFHETENCSACKELWIVQVLDALVKKECIIKFEDNNRGYRIQA